MWTNNNTRLMISHLGCVNVYARTAVEGVRPRNHLRCKAYTIAPLRIRVLGRRDTISIPEYREQFPAAGDGLSRAKESSRLLDADFPYQSRSSGKNRSR